MSVACESVEEHEAQHYSYDNDDNMVCASVWFEFVGGLVYMICGREIWRQGVEIWYENIYSFRFRDIREEWR